MVTELAKAPLPPLPICDEGHFLKCLRTMLAVLPKRATDELSGELLANAYRRMLGHHTKAEINFLTEQVLARCKWFPTIAECIEIIGEWRRCDEYLISQNIAWKKMRAEQEERAREEREANRVPMTPEERESVYKLMRELGLKIDETENENDQ